MKKLVLFLVLSCSGLQFWAQTTVIDKIVSFRLKDSGAMYDQNNNVDGYFFFYEVDKLHKGQREYAIQILDQNLNIVATKSFVDDNNTILISSSFNNKEIAFVFLNQKDKKFRVITYNETGEVSKDQTYEIKKKELNWFAQFAAMGYTELLVPVDDKGFIITTVSDTKGIGYDLRFLPSTTEGKTWEYNTPETDSNILSLNPIQSNELYLVALEMSKKSRMTTKTDISLVVYDVDSGNQLFKKLYSREKNPRLITNSFIEENGNIVVLGEYFKDGDNILNDKSLGLFIEVLDHKGNLVSDKTISWENKLFQKLKESNEDTKNRSLVYFHDIIKSKTGDYYAVGEMYRRTASAAGIAVAILSKGQSGNITQLSITDAVVYKFDKDFNFVNLDVFKKGKSRAQSPIELGSPQLNAHLLKAMGAFDFINIQNDVENDRFYANFIDYERLDSEDDKWAFVSVIQNEGKLTTDKIYIEKKKRYATLVLPGKVGHVLMLDYNKKEKKIELHLEKLNIN